ncbi:MAG: undecaprenyldiphospho-muramoylpentapeptide beta-N-acetylglucosaminyltransferase [Verrucomicrobia bacterium SCN 57-15]|nr:MAG: undecaprenyldiphospho-muramoylpentapeptide beta-N-acetylglucosaminyltransferase [Verrucomicrobia bacterium SCN 57-15]
MSQTEAPYIAIACGGTGGHLFPGMAVAEKLLEKGCDVLLLVSEKEIDQITSRSAAGMEVMRLPAVPLLKGNLPSFLKAFWKSFWIMRAHFKKRPPTAVLAMGGFTSAAPILAGKFAGARTALHEANSYAGRANRLLSGWVNHVFIGFSSAANQLRNRSVQFTGTPVRSQFQPSDPAAARMALGLEPESPVVLVMGGSQGASAINKAILEAVPLLLEKEPALQFLHLTGAATFESISKAYKELTGRAKVLPFLTEMELALAAASVTVSRAGASSLAELAAMELPAILIPYPNAADDHQYHNARALAQPGAARMVIQSQLKAEPLAAAILELITNEPLRDQLKGELRKWHYPNAADEIIETLLPPLAFSEQEATHKTLLKAHAG